MSSPVPNAAIRICRATPGDADMCGRICYEAFATINTQHNFAPELPTPEVGVGLLNMLFSHPHFYCVVAELDGTDRRKQLPGRALGYRRYWTNNRRAEC